MRVRGSGSKNEKIELQMTPMIDIVFQLLVFFIMTFKIILPEGDFNIKMPLAAPSQGAPDPNQLPPMKIRLKANSSGELASIQMNDRKMDSFSSLHNHLISVVGDERGPGSIAQEAEVELDCDYNLRYEYVIAAVSAVSGYLSDDGHIVKLIERIKFAPQRK